MDMTIMKAPREAAADLIARLGPHRALALAQATETRTEAPRWRAIAVEVECIVDAIEAREWGLDVVGTPDLAAGVQPRNPDAPAAWA